MPTAASPTVAAADRTVKRAATQFDAHYSRIWGVDPLRERAQRYETFEATIPDVVKLRAQGLQAYAYEVW